MNHSTDTCEHCKYEAAVAAGMPRDASRAYRVDFGCTCTAESAEEASAWFAANTR